MMDRQKIVLIWDSDIVWVESLKAELEKRGFLCEEADSEEELFEWMGTREKPVLCILSKETLEEFYPAIEEAFRILQKSIKIPMVLLLEKDDIKTELSALRAGASEVLMKEREVEIAVERLELLLKKTSGNVYEKSLENAYDTENSKTVFEKEFREIHLTIHEKQVLYELLKHTGQVVGRKELVAKYWTNREEKETRVVDTVVKQLRKKLESTEYQIQGIYGQGYLLKKE